MNDDYDLVFLLEEASMKALLDILLPRIIPKLVSNYQQISGSRKIGQYLEVDKLEKNTSHSFKIFMKGLQKILAEL
ncbi:hypothetical protein VB715_06860 [Crocosphaera sp. UHCC 0190]|uniref:hypothetical protein n=1 Tax=Crocosphaera sp. UHCC 0190 TaxID=3110246 RepID=UPI002B1F078B|nr:hypothetical protein [Crocosphaera sp. UHCC 0190]MEA5509480.1 hypothetical protein [Crocosphaera sp. UHCC 0190]